MSSAAHWPDDTLPVIPDGNLSHTVRMVDQTAALSPITLLTAPPSDLYFLDFYVECTVAGVAGTVAANGIYTGTNGSVTQASPILLLTSIVPPNAHLMYRATCWVASGDISFSASMLGIVGSPKYTIIARAARAWSTS